MIYKSIFRNNFWIISITLALLAVSCNKTEPLFQQVKSSQTGITFANNITANDTLNIINNTNMYNGGGVGIADFNNDGLQDIYFTGLMVDNELYLNKGAFKFDNVTHEAKVAATNSWSSGVAVVDINNDGLMDIYVCVTPYDRSEHNSSLFYINQGVNENNVPVFKEMAEEYNVAFSGHTTMAAFFDYDNDQDLDLYLMVNQFNKNSSMNRFSGRGSGAGSQTRDRLFRNDGTDSLGHPRFTDVSDEAGITKEGFGLGLNITDINRDGWKDIYVANDFYTSDLLYINNGDGTFTDKSKQIFKHTAYAAMGTDVADLNNDGYADVFTADMRPEDNYGKKKMLEPNNYSAYLRSKRHNYDDQFVRNVLQVYQGMHPQTGEPLYSEVGIYAGISETDWSWAPLMADFDNDGWRDLIVTNGFPKAMNDNDFEEQFELYPQFVSQSKLLDIIPSIKISNYAYRNNGDAQGDTDGLTFEDVTEKWGMMIPSYSNGAAHVDLNNDGALDLVVNNTNQRAFIFQNRLADLHPEKNNFLRIKLEGTGKNAMGLGTLLEIENGGKKQFHEFTTYRGYESSVEPIIHFGLEDSSTVEKLKVTWPDSSVQVIEDLQPNQVITVRQDNARNMKNEEPDSSKKQPLIRDISDELGIDYVHEERDYNDFNVQPLLPHKLSQYGPGLSLGDVNNDGLSDIYVSGAYEHQGVFLVQRPDGSFVKENLLVGNNPEYPEEEMSSLFFDADGDGDDDLYVVSGSYEHPPGVNAYQDRLFINEGGRFLLSRDALPSFLSSGSAVRAADFDRDGDLDLFVGGRVSPHRYPESVNSYILENISDRERVRFKIVNDQKAPMLNEIGMVSDALWTDFNNDGWTDLILAGEWMPLKFLKNESGTFVEVTDETGISDYKGWWNSLCGADFDYDGDTDYIAGNLGTNTYFKASDEHPVSVYANDFDNNGVFDMIPTVYYKNREGYKVEVPYHGRINLSRQIPSVVEKFETFHSYASTTMDEFLSRFESEDMLTYRANYLKSSYIENLGEGQFRLSALPDKVQWAPIFGCVTEDVNNDGKIDVMLSGNNHGMELSVGRADALNGLVLAGNGDGSFDTLDFEESGFFVPGDGKALVSYMNDSNELVVVASQNRGPLKMFKKEVKSRPISVQPMDAFVMIEFNDGRKQKKELYYGSGFLSQSERYLIPPDDYTKIEISDYMGNTRIISND